MMFVRETKDHQYSLQFENLDAVNRFISDLETIPSDSLKKLTEKLKDRVSDKYSTDKYKYSILLFANEVPVLLGHALILMMATDNSQKKSGLWSKLLNKNK